MQSPSLTPGDAGPMPQKPLPHLETFAKAAELGSFTAAAQAFGLSQAAVSQRIRALEQSLSISLFRRQGGHVFLTEAGRRLHDYAERIHVLHLEARQQLTGKRAPVTGELSLAASSVPGEHLLPAALATFREKHPNIRVRATVGDTQTVLDCVEHGRAHLGLVGGKGDSPHLKFRSFACDQMALIVPAGHALARRKRVSVDQLLRQPLIVREGGSSSRWCLEQALKQAGKSPNDVRVTLELGSNEAIKEAVLRGLGVAVLSTQVVEEELHSGRLRALPVAGLPLKRDMFLVWDQRRVLPIAARLFLDFLAPCPHAERRS
jgi:DNA-binding transcriptional LysR family regulator